MRVVSQNRNFSFDFDRTVFWKQYNIIYAKIGTESIAIGQYTSDERAAEVFEDMHKAYGPVGLISTNLSKEQAAQFIGSSNTPIRCIEMNEPGTGITTYDSIVYYMPKEWEKCTH